jgi:hypothetical protein
MNEKSILEQALLQVQTLEEAVKQNAKGILASTMKQELSDLLKESLEEEEKVETPEKEVSEEETMEEQPTPDEEEKDDMSDDEDANADEAGADDAENVDDLDNEDPTKGIDSLDSEDDMTDEPDADNAGGPSDFDADNEDDDVMDMTGASDDEVLKVFKAMKPEDGIVVKKDGNQVEFGTGEDDYIIKLDSDDVTDEVEEEEEMPAVEDGDSTEEAPTDETETLYEIELDEEEEEDSTEEETTESEDDTKEVEATEAARTKWNPHGDKGDAERTGLKSKKVFKAGSQINEEVETLKKQNAEYKKALVLFKEKLNEVAVFNANLAYATRLFTEHSTTKQEKLNILKRFDTVSTMNESKGLFNTIKAELGNKTTVTESVVEKISNAPSTSSSTEVLAEAKAYENPQFKRMKDLMSKMK